MSNQHPSYFVLDGLRLGLDDADARAHVAGCAACAAHLQAEPAGAPAWLAGVSLAPRKVTVARRPWWRRPLVLGPSFSALALAAVLLVLRARTEGPAPGIREKGGPALAVFIKRGEEVFSWDGRAPVRPGDRLRFEVHAGGYHFISVALRSGPAGEPVVLHEGPVKPATSFLPISFRVDDAGDQEVVSVLFGERPLPARLHAEASDARPTSEAWRQILVFGKQRLDARPDAKPSSSFE